MERLQNLESAASGFSERVENSKAAMIRMLERLRVEPRNEKLHIELRELIKSAQEIEDEGQRYFAELADYLGVDAKELRKW